MNNLYFIRHIARAYDQPDVKTALREAFEEIQGLGQKSNNRQGFLQFLRFMVEVERHCAAIWKMEGAADHGFHDVSLEQKADVLNVDPEEIRLAQELINSTPQWQEEYEMFCKEAEESEMLSAPMKVIVEKDGDRVHSFRLGKLPLREQLHDIRPGTYTVKLDTGRIIWRERLTAKDLIWVYAFPERGLRLAADTGDAVPLTTKEAVVLNGEGIIRVYPGMERGRLELEVGGRYRDRDTG